MIVSKRYQLTLHKSYFKVLSLSPAINDSFVFLASRNTGIDVLVHCTQYGKIMWEHSFDDPIADFTLMTPSIGYLLMTKKNAIFLFDLEKHKTKLIPFYFIFDGSEQCSILAFSDTKLMCIVQHGLYNQPTLKLSYFCYPDHLQQPVVQYQSKENEWNHQNLIRRGNNSSQVIWFNKRQVNEPSFKVFQVHKYNNQWRGALRIVQSRDSLADFYDLNRLQFAILDIWQLNKGEFMLVTLTFQNQSKVRIVQDSLTKYNYIINQQTQRLRDAKLQIHKEFNDLIVTQLYLGQYFTFRSFLFQTNAQQQKSPVYFFDAKTQQLIGEQEWQCSYRYKFFVPGFDGNTLVECQYQNVDVNDIVVDVKRAIEPRVLAMHFLLEMYGQFDEDLLKQAVQFIPIAGQ